ncbi:hypothetical protein MMA231_03656 (plasmid) [Asticcacaulis sp. MM231]|uniref:hypothetical protein n=1 Tax=Asticcacaulis sp. MM231 TaxID=3157666 RepID=UPI0032D5A1CE
MKMTYLPSLMAIVQDDSQATPVATVTINTLDGISIHVLARAMAMAPSLVCLLDGIMDIEPDEDGDRTLSTEGMQPIRDALSAFTVADFVPLSHYVHIIK